MTSQTQVHNQTQAQTKQYAHNLFSPTPTLYSVFTDSSDLTAANAAKIPYLSKYLGLSPNIIKVDIPYAENQAIIKRIGQTPSLAAWVMEDTAHAAIARENLDGLENVFRRTHETVLAFEKLEQENFELYNRARAGNQEASNELKRRKGWTEDEI